MNKNSRLAQLMYALGYLGISIFAQTTVKWYQYYYAPPELNQAGLRLLVPLGLIGFAMIVARIFDGIADPLVAYWSDTFTSKRGRRIPFIAWGTAPLAVIFILLWFPPVAGVSLWNFVYLSVMLSLLFIFFTIVVTPYLALIGEITTTPAERIRLTMLQGITQVLGVMVAEVGSGFLINLYGFRIMGMVLGVLGFVTLMLTPLFIREPRPEETRRSSAGLLQSVSLTLKNSDFTSYLASQAAIWFGINTLTIAMPYITEVLLNMSAEVSGYMVGGAFVLAVAVSPLIPRIVLRLGKKRTMMSACAMLAVVLTLTGLFGVVFHGAAAVAVVVLAGLPLAVVFTVPNAMVADIAELDGRQRGEHREAMFFGAQGLALKLVQGVSSLVTPLLFRTLGYSGGQALGLRTVGPLAGVVALTGIYFLRNYRLEDGVGS